MATPFTGLVFIFGTDALSSKALFPYKSSTKGNKEFGGQPADPQHNTYHRVQNHGVYKY